MVFEKLRAILAEQLTLDENKITMESDLKRDLNADSLDTVEIIMCIEDEFGIEVDEDAAAEVKSVGDIVREIERLLNK